MSGETIYRRELCSIEATKSGLRVYERGKYVMTIPYLEIEKMARFYQEHNFDIGRTFSLDYFVRLYTKASKKPTN